MNTFQLVEKYTIDILLVKGLKIKKDSQLYKNIARVFWVLLYTGSMYLINYSQNFFSDYNIDPELRVYLAVGLATISKGIRTYIEKK